jgi:hypothetical protein
LADEGTEVKKIAYPGKSVAGYSLTRGGKKMTITPKDGGGYEVKHGDKEIDLKSLKSVKTLKEQAKPKREIIKEISAGDFKKSLKIIND